MKAFSKQSKKNGSVSDTSISIASNAPSDVPTEFDIRKKIKYGNPLQAAWGIFAEYCSHSTIHGIRYLGERRRPRLERIFWIFVFVLSIAGCARLCLNIWIKWNQTPVIVSFAEKSTPVWDVPYPSIVLCPEIKNHQSDFNFSRAHDILKSLKGHGMIERPDQLTPEEFRYFQTIVQLCSEDVERDLEFVNEEVIDFGEVLKELAPSLNISTPFCKWRNKIVSCYDLFKMILTDEGVCYQFNGLHESEILRYPPLNISEALTPSQWSAENGYEANVKSVAYPYRVIASGARDGIYMALQGFDYDMDYLCSGPVQGFKIFLISPDDSPQAIRHYFRVPFQQEVLISVKPTMITTSEKLRKYSPQRRQCYFSGERYLQYYKIYTQSNCNYECLTNFTYAKCGCVRFSMPRTDDIPVCGSSKVRCYQQAEDDLLRLEFEEGIKESGENYRGMTECNCLPSCTSLEYEVEISQADFDVHELLRQFNDSYLDENPGFVMSRLSIFFKQYQFITTKRSELYGTTDFLANCGGLLGLFMGFSTLSLVELIYFCTVRLTSNIKMRMKKKHTRAPCQLEK